jgi:hypothetical protein
LQHSQSKPKLIVDRIGSQRRLHRLLTASQSA